MSAARVEILGTEPGKKGVLLDRLRDAKTGQYFAPSFPDHPVFDDIRKLQQQGTSGRGAKCAILDTGMMLGHPWIRRTLEESIDLTGEGPEDSNGHGTLVTLIYLLTAPGSALLNVKIARADGRGEEKDLIRGMEIAVEKGALVMNLSVGVYHKKWGLLDCRGDCPVCQAAERAAKAGVLVCAAAGNEPAKTYCPAKVGLVKQGIGVMSVAAFDYERGTLAPYSGKGSIAGPVGPYPMTRVD